MGCAPFASRLDSGGYATLGRHVGTGFHENALFPSQACSGPSREVFCYECIVAPNRTDSPCLQVSEIE